jgi:hypothetical protein
LSALLKSFIAPPLAATLLIAWSYFDAYRNHAFPSIPDLNGYIVIKRDIPTTRHITYHILWIFLIFFSFFFGENYGQLALQGAVYFFFFRPYFFLPDTKKLSLDATQNYNHFQDLVKPNLSGISTQSQFCPTQSLPDLTYFNANPRI